MELRYPTIKRTKCAELFKTWTFTGQNSSRVYNIFSSAVFHISVLQDLTTSRSTILSQESKSYILVVKMLTKADFHQNYRIIDLSCKMGVIPLKVNGQNWDLEVLDSKWKRWMCKAHYGVYALHTAYIALRLPYLLLKGVHIPLVSLLIHFTVLVGMTSICFWHLTAFFRWPGITVTCFNRAFGSQQCERTGKTLLHTWVLKNNQIPS